MSCIPTNKFDPAGSTTSTSRNSDLGGTVNVKGSDGKVVNTYDVDGNGQIRFTKSLLCADQGQQTFNATFTGDATNKPATGSFNLKVGDSKEASLGFVKKIVPGPGIYISNPNGDGVVTISLEPIRSVSGPVEDLDWITWTISDLADPNPSDQSMFLATGGEAGIATNRGIAVRSRDGVNWVDINNKDLAIVSLNPALNLQSSTFPGSGQAYVGTLFYSDPGTTTSTNLGLMYGIEGKKDNASCSWCSDDFRTTGSILTISGSSIPNKVDSSFFCFYNTGSLVTNSLFLVGTQTDPLYSGVTAGSIYRFVDFPANFQDINSNVAVANELNSTGSMFRQAHSNLETASFSSYQIIYADSGLNKLWGSNRSGKTAGTWGSVLNATVPLYGVQFGGGVWVACGDDDTIYTSNDGSTWTKRSTKRPGSRWRWICYGDGKFVVVGSSGRAAVSEDGGGTWTIAQTGTANNLKCVAFSQSLCRFVAVGSKRTIISVKV
jgi:hypothetical protein